MKQVENEQMIPQKKKCIRIEDIEPDGYYSRKSAAEAVGRDVCQINRWVNSGKLKQRRLRGFKRPVYLGSDIRRMLLEVR